MMIDRRSFLVVAAAGLVPLDAILQAGCRAGAQSSGSVAIRIYGLSAITMQGNRLAVVMADAGRAGLSTMHEPRLYAPAASVGSGSAPSSGQVGQLAYWTLTGYRVSIVNSSTSGVTPFKPKRPKNNSDRRPDQDTAGDIGWVASMGRIRNKHGLRPELLAARPPEIVASQAFFDDGELMATFPPATTTTDFQRVEFKFDPAPQLGSYQQALADATVVRPVSSATVTFTLTPFQGGAPKSVVLKVSGRLDVSLENNAIGHKCKDSETQKLSHFAAYYALAETSNETDHPVPIWAAGDPLQCGSLDEVIRCPPMRF